MTAEQKQKRVRILRLAGADPAHRPQRSIDRELAALLGIAGGKAAASRSGAVQYRSRLDARGVRRWTDAVGREVRHADLTDEMRSVDHGGFIRYAMPYVTR